MSSNGKKDRLDRIEELLHMTAAQTAENWKELKQWRAEFRADLTRSRKEHDREIKEIRALFKAMIKRIAA